MHLGDAKAFLEDNDRAVLVTRRLDDRLQSSPMVVGIDGDERAVISSRETAYKTKNLKRDPRATLCVMNNRFFGEWIQIDGRAELISLPNALAASSTITGVSPASTLTGTITELRW